jgi:N-acetylmuramoyl-L-alanine amidase
MRMSSRVNLVSRFLVFALVFCLTVRSTLNAADPTDASARGPLSLSETLFQHANTLRDDLHNKPFEERSMSEYRRALDSFNQVIRLNTDTHFSADSLARMAELQREMADATGDGTLYQQAITTLRRIINEHPQSSLVGEALVQIAEIYQENLQDLDGAAEAYRGLIAYFPASVMAREARAVLARFEAELRNRPVDVLATESNFASTGSPTLETQITNVRNFSGPDYARVVVDVSGDVNYKERRVGENGLSIDLSGAAVSSALAGRRFIIGDTNLLKRIMIAPGAAGEVAIRLEVGPLSDYSAFKLESPSRVVIDLHGINSPARPRPTRSVREETVETVDATSPSEAVATKKAPVAQPASPVNPSAPLASVPAVAKPNGKNQKPVLGLPEINEPIMLLSADDHKPAAPAANKTAGELATQVDAKVAESAIKCIVIDPGHGGHDTGTISPTGLREKDLVLDVARRLRSYIKQRYPDIEVVLTRDTDRFIALEERTAIANSRRADLFISVHANASPSSVASGVETFFVSPDRAKDEAKKTEPAKETTTTEAVAENTKPASQPAEQKSQPVFASVTVGNRVAESRELARYIQSGLVRGIGAQSPRSGANRGVKHAPFAVLLGAAMPSVLAEVSFMSNPRDEALLKTSQFRERIAASLFAGLNAFLKKKRPDEAQAKK